tara:strand:- start:7235 stop:7438 length:204 start_codon:yes stop_codon:yes gene_type:complete
MIKTIRSFTKVKEKTEKSAPNQMFRKLRIRRKALHPIRPNSMNNLLPREESILFMFSVLSKKQKQFN